MNIVEKISKSKVYEEIGLETTSVCNLQCSYCFNNSSANNHTKMDIGIIKKIINEAANLDTKPSVCLSGGEFFTRNDWKEIIEYSNERNVEYSIITNGTLLSRDILNFLERYKPKLLQISLDGIIETDNILRFNNKTQIVLDCLDDIAKSPNLLINTRVRLTVSKVNKDHLEDTIYYLRNLGFQVSLGYLLSMGRGVENPFSLSENDIFEVHKRLVNYQLSNNIDFRLPVLSTLAACPLLDETKPLGIRIKANGEVYACFGIEIDEFKLGNIQTCSLDEIIKSDKLYNAINYMYNRYIIMRDNECTKCLVKDVCMGGCAGNSLYEEGSLNIPAKRLCNAATKLSKYLALQIK